MHARTTLAAAFLLSLAALASPAAADDGLALAGPAVPGTIDAVQDPMDCVDAVLNSGSWCFVSEIGCTSTSGCTGAEVDQSKKTLYCVVGVCTPWLPTCFVVTVWYADQPSTPTYSDETCWAFLLVDQVL